MKKKDSEIFSD